ncbi:hypothetical protein [Pseudoroseicyclus tamaricis]|uniref:Uncharacterized protein n=1 Tax=Pseudoroseicyclus tamaricis TaxID=2705421 RepID=A0A6B2JPP7_9RHOB|nr:hypothetical protein [Pseudoroseicyclus tamaricis]NDU99979.1 hypothetical protein [Pseudoroseicyclus tamaricis]
MTRLTILALITAGPAFAECPVPADMETGIRVEYSDGLVEMFRASGPGVVESIGVDYDEPIYWMEMAQGLYVTDYAEVWGDFIDLPNATRHDYGAPAAELPVPEPAGRWDARPDLLYPDEAPVSVTQSYVFGPEEAISVGACRFDALEVTTAYQSDDNYIEGVTYLSDFGFGWLAWMDDETDGYSTYSAVSIAPMAPGDWPLKN